MVEEREEKRSRGRPKGWQYWPLAALMKSGAYAMMTASERALITCLDNHTNRRTGLCCPGEALIRRETSLSHSSIWRARESLRGRVFELELAKYNRQGNRVYHYLWMNIQSTSRGTSLKFQASRETRVIKGVNYENNKLSTSRGNPFHSETNLVSPCNKPGSTVKPKLTITNSKIKNPPMDKQRSAGIRGSEEEEGCISGSRDVTELGQGHEGDDPKQAALVNSQKEDDARVNAVLEVIKRHSDHRWWVK